MDSKAGVQSTKVRVARNFDALVSQCCAYDESLAKLPAPYRRLVVDRRLSEKLGSPGEEIPLERWLYGRVAYEDLIATMQRFSDYDDVLTDVAKRHPAFAAYLAHIDGESNVTGGMLCQLRWRNEGRHFFQTTDDLERGLAASDIARDIPVQWLKPPYSMQYVKFGERLVATERLFHEQSGEHILEGCFLSGGEYEADGKLARYLEFLFVGSPFGKANILDDAIKLIRFPIVNEKASLLEVLENACAAEQRSISRTISPEENEHLLSLVFHAAKVLLYLNSDKTIQTTVVERDAILTRLRRAGVAKIGKLTRQLDRATDRIIIGPTNAVSQNEDAANTGRVVATHWRRGHFRQQSFGEHRAQSKVIWIEPVLVNAALALGDPKTTPYHIVGKDKDLAGAVLTGRRLTRP